MYNMREELMADVQTLVELKIQKDPLSTLLFLKAIMMNKCYKFTKSRKNNQTLTKKSICKKRKRTGDPDTNNKNIQPAYRDDIFYRKMCYAYNA